MEYVQAVVTQKKLASREIVQACQRYLEDLENKAYDFRTRDAEFVIQIIEKTIVHDQGERLDGSPLRGEPFILEPWQKFIIYNLLAFIMLVLKSESIKRLLSSCPVKTVRPGSLLHCLGGLPC